MLPLAAAPTACPHRRRTATPGAAHNAWGQAWREVGADPHNEVVILTGTGDWWHTGDPEKLWATPFRDWSPDSQLKMYQDMTRLLENLAFGVDVPTIAAINGPGTHCELGTLCDITLCVEEADFFDPHFLAGSTPGDGMGLTLQHTMGTKRAAYAMYTGQRIGGRAALDLGIVNEVLPRTELVPRAWQIAEMIMKRPKVARQLTHAIAVRPWKQALVSDLGFHATHQLWGMTFPESEGESDLMADITDRFRQSESSLEPK